MKALFIWRRESKTYLNQLSDKIDDVTLVYNNDSFQKQDINSFDHIFILVELNWSNNLFEGYQIASSIIKAWEDDNKPPNILFFSFIEQLKLFELTKDLDKFFVKSFAQYTLPFEGNFKLKPYSKSKWKYLKKYALTEFGILNRISHSITTILNKNESEINKESQTIINQLKELKSIIGLKINNAIESKKITDKTYLLDLNRLIISRINEINLKSSNLNEDNVPANEKSKDRLLLLEDNPNYTEKITAVLEPHFEVVPFDNGKEALLELKQFNLNYSILIADLELLEKNKKLDQEVQGIELVDFVRDETPHIAWRILTGLPRKGIKELIDVELNNILHKNQLDYFGYDEGMDEFISKLKAQAKRNVYLIRMKGPDTKFWAEKTNQGNEGGKFKRFYYDLLNSYPTFFNKMWIDIYKIVKELIDNPTSSRISTTFIKIDDASDWLYKENRTLDDKIDLLKRILIHRLIFFMNYKPGKVVYYKGNYEKALSNLAFWDGDLPSNPRAYTPILGLKTAKIKSTEFLFKGYGQLFDKEIEFLKNYENEFDEFFDAHEEFCWVIDLVHTYISEDQKSDSSNFKEKYEAQKDNVFEINYEYSERILKTLSSETKKLSPSNTWNNVLKLLSEFKYGKQLDKEQTVYKNLNSELKRLIDLFIEK